MWKMIVFFFFYCREMKKRVYVIPPLCEKIMIFKRRHEEKNVRESDNFYGGVILGSDPFEIILGKLT